MVAAFGQKVSVKRNVYFVRPITGFPLTAPISPPQRARGIVFTAYCPLGRPGSPDVPNNAPDLLGNPVVTGIAEQHNCTPAQVVLAWAMERGTSPIPKSTNPRRLQENFASQNVALTHTDMVAINALDRHYRYVDGTFWTRPGGPYTLENLWDE